MGGKLEKEESVISELLNAIGPWRKHIVIGGGYAPIIYKLYFDSSPSGNPPVGTLDIDTLIPRKVPEVSRKDIAKHLEDAGFVRRYKDHENPATESYTKEIGDEEIEVEFLTDDSTRGDKDKNVSIAGVVAQPLSYLKLSLKKTLVFKTRSGGIGNVVSPGAWVFHKGLTFPRRGSGSKYYKDLYGIWYVGTQLGNFSENALVELEKLQRENSKWAKTFSQNLRQWVRDASPNEWLKLEAQDPFGALRRKAFENLVKQMT